MTTPWITVADVKARMASLDPRGLHLSDDIKDTLCERACSWIEKEAAIRVIGDPLAPIRLRFNGNGRERLELPYAPVLAITELVINQAPVTFGTSSEFAANLVKAYNDSTGLYYPTRFPCGHANILVGYQAGYTLANVPGYLKSLAEAKAILMFMEKDRWGVQLKNLPGQTVSFLRDLMAEEKQTLASLRDQRWLAEDFGGVPA